MIIYCYFCRFHFAKALFAKLKGKFRLASFFRPKGSDVAKKISHVIRQYFAIPLLRVDHFKREVDRLGEELRQLSQKVTPLEASRLNKFHNYFVSYWCRLQGADHISVFGATHTTNNIIER